MGSKDPRIDAYIARSADFAQPILTHNSRSDEAMGHLGRVTRISDLPSKMVLTGYIKQAMKLNDTGVNVARVETAVEWIAEGKTRNWKHQK